MRAKRMLVRSGIIACGVVLFGMLFRGSHSLLARHSTVTGTREQNGWTFVRRFSGEPQPDVHPNAFIAFVRRVFGQPEEPTDDGLQYPALKFLAPQEDGRPDGDMSRAGLTAQVVSSTGDHFALGLAGNNRVTGSMNSTNADTFARDVYLHLPAVPATYQWIDITVADKKGHQATWRVFDLPQLAHQVLGAMQAGPITPVPGITLKARAWWDFKDTPVPPNGWSGPENDFLPVNAEIRMQNKPTGGSTHFWRLTDFKLREEWEPQHDNKQTNSFTFGESFRPYAESTTNPSSVAGFAAPHPRQQHTVQIDSALAEHQTANETVTFHNLHLSRMGTAWSLDPDANSVVQSLSGVIVRLVLTAGRADKSRPLSTYGITKDAIYYRFQIDQYGPNVTLPASPLYRRYHHPIDVGGSIDIPADNYKGSEGWSSDTPHAVEGGFSLITLPKNHVLPTLKFTITQDTVVRRIPLRFVVPVTEGKPKQRWYGSDNPPESGSDGGGAK